MTWKIPYKKYWSYYKRKFHFCQIFFSKFNYPTQQDKHFLLHPKKLFSRILVAVGSWQPLFYIFSVWIVIEALAESFFCFLLEIPSLYFATELTGLSTCVLFISLRTSKNFFANSFVYPDMLRKSEFSPAR